MFNCWKFLSYTLGHSLLVRSIDLSIPQAPNVLIDFGVLHLVGDMSINQVTRSRWLQFSIYGLKQQITEPTRVTAKSQSIIDLCLTNIPDI